MVSMIQSDSWLTIIVSKLSKTTRGTKSSSEKKIDFNPRSIQSLRKLTDGTNDVNGGCWIHIPILFVSKFVLESVLKRFFSPEFMVILNVHFLIFTHFVDWGSEYTIQCSFILILDSHAIQPLFIPLSMHKEIPCFKCFILNKLLYRTS